MATIRAGTLLMLVYGENGDKGWSGSFRVVKDIDQVQVLALVRSRPQALKRGHFAILAEIDLGMALTRHLAVDFQPYLILIACNPPLAQRAIQADEQIGSILLCNILVQQHGDAHG
jgi:Domain of unknown function DUF302